MKRINSSYPISKADILKNEDLEYFKRGESENPRFWSRLGGEPSFKNKVILDVGCGHGSLGVYMAIHGAKKVIGIDIDQSRIEFAKQNVKLNYPKIKNKIKFKCCDVLELASYKFDIIVSKDSFEHIIFLHKCLLSIKLKLKRNGKVYIGFGPLYNSPFGDHGRLNSTKVPWGHLIFPEKFLINRLNMKGLNVESVRELGLNKLSLKDYREVFLKSGFKIEKYGINISEKLVSKLFSLVRKIPVLEEYFSHNLYCIMSKKESY